MRKVTSPVLPQNANLLPSVLTRILRDHANSINDFLEGTSAPTTGSYAQGDFMWNTEPSEAGSASSKYVVLGWVCTVSGSPGTWLDCRVLTGN